MTVVLFADGILVAGCKVVDVGEPCDGFNDAECLVGLHALVLEAVEMFGKLFVEIMDEGAMDLFSS